MPDPLAVAPRRGIPARESLHFKNKPFDELTRGDLLDIVRQALTRIGELDAAGSVGRDGALDQTGVESMNRG
jgi:hypothetical protein